MTITTTELLESNNDFLGKLSAEFPKSEVKSRAGGFGKNLDYIDIPSTINRFNAVCGGKWDWTISESTLSITDEGKFLATIRGTISIELPDGRLVTRSGIGADLDGKDPDKALKTADAEALKKAGHKFGVGLYLWDEEKRNEIARFRDNTANASVSELQKAVVSKTGLSQEELKTTFGDALKNRQGLLNILAT